MVLSASSITSFHADQSPWRYFTKQLMWAGLGVIALTITYKVPYLTWRRMAKPILVLGVLGMLAPVRARSRPHRQRCTGVGVDRRPDRAAVGVHEARAARLLRRPPRHPPRPARRPAGDVQAVHLRAPAGRRVDDPAGRPRFGRRDHDDRARRHVRRRRSGHPAVRDRRAPRRRGCRVRLELGVPACPLDRVPRRRGQPQPRELPGVAGDDLDRQRRPDGRRRRRRHGQVGLRPAGPQRLHLRHRRRGAGPRRRRRRDRRGSR